MLKKLGVVLGFLLVGYIGWFLFHILRFVPPEKPEIGNSGREIQGVYHIHTKFSDGWKTRDKVVRIASGADLDFMILTDHGNPNLPSISSQGWQEDVLVLAGSEASTNRGHLVSLNFSLPEKTLTNDADLLSHQISKLGGFCVISHPYSKVSWSWGREGNYSGLEIVNADTMFRKGFFRLFPFMPALVFKPNLALLKSMSRPYKNLRKWDELNKTKEMYGFFSSDAHTFYKALFSLLQIHIVLEEPLASEFHLARTQVFNSLSRGRFYNAIEAAAPARGFRFFGKNGQERIDMGSQVRFSPGLSLHIETPYPFQKEVCLVADGEIVLRSTQDHIVFEPEKPGVYRVEVLLKERSPLDENIPWILSNPIFIRAGDL